MVMALDDLFPGMRGSGFRIASPADQRYNCVAWAAGDTGNWWWPDVAGVDFWPAGAVRAETVAAFQQAFETLNYVVTTNESLQSGFEKIAIFATFSSAPTHVARQIGDRHWTSKIGDREDI